MASQSDLSLRIATIMDASGLKKADKGIKGLEASAKKLGKTIGLALGGAALIGFGKSAVKAFAEDEAAAARLAQVVKNLGMEMQLPAIEDFIGNMEMATGVADDELRPAMQSLLTQFRDVADAQNVMSLAVDVAAGSGESLATVVSDITAAYAGNMKGLKKYNLGITQAELKTMSFSEVMDRFNAQFKGSNAAYLDTYAGKMKVLGTAANTAKETIGKGLVDALMAVTGSIDVQDLATKMQGAAQVIADMFVKVGNIIGQNWALVKQLGIAIVATFTATKAYAGAMAFIDILKKVRDFMKKVREVSLAAAIAEMAALNPLAALVGGAALVATIILANKAMDAFEGDAKNNLTMPDFTGLDDPKYKKVQADKLKAEKMSAKLEKEKLALLKAQMMFDMNRIQIIAALKGQVSDDERKRLELQMAILNEDSATASKLTMELAKSQGITTDLTRWLGNMPDAKNPFAAWKGYLDEIELQAKRIREFKPETPDNPSNVPPEKTPGGYTKGESPYNPYYGLVVNGNSMPGGYTDNKSPYNPYYGIGSDKTIVINIDGKAVAESLANGNNSGYSVSNNRVTGTF